MKRISIITLLILGLVLLGGCNCGEGPADGTFPGSETAFPEEETALADEESSTEGRELKNNKSSETVTIKAEHRTAYNHQGSADTGNAQEDQVQPTPVQQQTEYHQGNQTTEYHQEVQTAEHVHDYQLTAHLDPTCTLEGFSTYTCGGCGSSYTDILHASGHSFTEHYITILHEAETEEVWVTDQPEWTEPAEYEYHEVCSECGVWLDNMTDEEANDHLYAHLDEGGSGKSELILIMVKDEVYHPEEGHPETRVISDPWSEEILDYRECTVCGARE